MDDELRSWLVSRIPTAWSSGAPEVLVDADEILVTVTVTAPAPASTDTPESIAAAEAARIDQFREESRTDRMKIAHEAERRFRRKLAWGARCGAQSKLFSTLSVPVMTRLRMPERLVLDTLVAGGVARSRSDALAWCVKLVGMHQADWIQGLRDALVKVDEVRRRGPVN